MQQFVYVDVGVEGVIVGVVYGYGVEVDYVVLGEIVVLEFEFCIYYVVQYIGLELLVYILVYVVVQCVGQVGGGGNGFCLYLVVFVVVVYGVVGGYVVVQFVMLCVEVDGYGLIEQGFCVLWQLGLWCMLMDLQQQFGLFGEVFGLVVLGVQFVVWIVQVVFEVLLLVGVVVFLDVFLCVGCQGDSELVGDVCGVVQIVLFVCCFEGCDYGFVVVYVCVLFLVWGQCLQVCVLCFCVQ